MLGTAAAKQWSKLGSHLKYLNLTFPSVSFYSGIRNDPAFFWSENRAKHAEGNQRERAGRDPYRRGERTRGQLPRSGFGLKFLSPLSAQDFHLGFEGVHARADAFIFFCGPVDRSVDRALAD